MSCLSLSPKANSPKFAPPMKRLLIGFSLVVCVAFGGHRQLIAASLGHTALSSAQHLPTVTTLYSRAAVAGHVLRYVSMPATFETDSEGVLEEKEKEEKEEQDGKPHHEFELFSSRQFNQVAVQLPLTRLPFRLYLLQGVLRI
jgi:hypothetical protein